MIETPCFFEQTTVRVATRVIAYAYMIFHVFNSWRLGYVYYHEWPNSGDEDAKFHQMACSVLITYSSFYLADATLKRNLQSVNFWIITNGIIFIVAVAISGMFKVARAYDTWNLLIMLFRTTLEIYAIYVVCRFYADEVLEHNVVADPKLTTDTTDEAASYSGYQIATTNSYHRVDIETIRAKVDDNPSKCRQMFDNLSNLGSHTYI